MQELKPCGSCRICYQIDPVWFALPVTCQLLCVTATHLEGVVVQLTDGKAELLHIFSNALISMCQATQGGCCIVGPIAGVLPV